MCPSPCTSAPGWGQLPAAILVLVPLAIPVHPGEMKTHLGRQSPETRPAFTGTSDDSKYLSLIKTRSALLDFCRFPVMTFLLCAPIQALSTRAHTHAHTRILEAQENRREEERQAQTGFSSACPLASTQSWFPPSDGCLTTRSEGWVSISPRVSQCRIPKLN